MWKAFGQNRDESLKNREGDGRLSDNANLEEDHIEEERDSIDESERERGRLFTIELEDAEVSTSTGPLASAPKQNNSLSVECPTEKKGKGDKGRKANLDPTEQVPEQGNGSEEKVKAPRIFPWQLRSGVLVGLIRRVRSENNEQEKGKRRDKDDESCKR